MLDCHHVTGGHTLLLKVKTRDTQSLEQLLGRMRSIEGVTRTETMVVLSTHTERTRVAGEPPFEGTEPVGPAPVQKGGPPILAGVTGPKGIAPKPFIGHLFVSRRSRTRKAMSIATPPNQRLKPDWSIRRRSARRLFLLSFASAAVTAGVRCSQRTLPSA